MQTSIPVPDVAVIVNGRDLPSKGYADLIEVSVQQDTEALSECTLKLSAWDDQKIDLAWVDDQLFSAGGEIEIMLGYVDALESVFKGEIIGLQIELASEQAPCFIVRGYDRRHRLMRGKCVRSFVKMKDSDIAAQIARENGLTASVDDSKVSLEYVLQYNQTDLEFLWQRASAIGYEVLVDDKTLHFRPFQTKADAAVVLQADRDLLEFSARLSAHHQVGAVEVRGWDASAKEPIVGKASGGQEASMGSSGGPKSGDQAFGKATLAIVDRPIEKQEEAEKIALGVLERLALGFIQGEGSCPGRTDLQAGAGVDVQGAGKRFSGKYYLTSVKHIYSPKTGYSTSFSARRNAT